MVTQQIDGGIMTWSICPQTDIRKSSIIPNGPFDIQYPVVMTFGVLVVVCATLYCRAS